MNKKNSFRFLLFAEFLGLIALDYCSWRFFGSERFSFCFFFFSVLMEILAGFPVSDRPQCPPFKTDQIGTV